MAIKGYCTIDAKNIRESDKAVLLDDGTVKEWVPKTALEDYPDVGETGEAIIKEWWAKEKGFI